MLREKKVSSGAPFQGVGGHCKMSFRKYIFSGSHPPTGPRGESTSGWHSGAPSFEERELCHGLSARSLCLWSEAPLVRLAQVAMLSPITPTQVLISIPASRLSADGYVRYRQIELHLSFSVPFSLLSSSLLEVFRNLDLSDEGEHFWLWNALIRCCLIWQSLATCIYLNLISYNELFSSSVALATLRVLSSHMWPPAITLDISAIMEHSMMTEALL